MNTKHLAAKFLTPGLKKFSNRHKGESCYIFGDGPSLKWFDLSLFNDRPGICCNMIPFHKDFHKLDVRYVTMVEPWFFAPPVMQPKVLSHTQNISAEYKKFMLNTPDKEFFISLSNLFSVRGKNINYVFRGLPEYRNETDELLGQFDLFSGSFQATLALACYLGFSDIYLIGFDGWTIQPSRAGHWYELGEGPVFEASNFGDDYLNIVKRQANIYAISPEGDSKSVINVNYENFKGTPAVYKENYELANLRNLKILATRPIYKIF